MRNRKGQAFEVVLFALVMIAVGALVIMILKVQNTNTGLIEVNEADSTASLISEGLVTRTECLGTGEAGVISWDKIADLDPNCAMKAPWTWAASVYVVAEDGWRNFGDDRCALKTDASGVSRKSVTLLRGGEKYQSEMELRVRSLSFDLELDRESNTRYVLKLEKQGDCAVNAYRYRAQILNKDTGIEDTASNAPRVSHGSSTGTSIENNFAHTAEPVFLIDIINEVQFNNDLLRVEVWPVGEPAEKYQNYRQSRTAEFTGTVSEDPASMTFSINSFPPPRRRDFPRKVETVRKMEVKFKRQSGNLCQTNINYDVHGELYTSEPHSHLPASDHQSQEAFVGTTGDLNTGEWATVTKEWSNAAERPTMNHLLVEKRSESNDGFACDKIEGVQVSLWT